MMLQAYYIPLFFSRQLFIAGLLFVGFMQIVVVVWVHSIMSTIACLLHLVVF